MAVGFFAYYFERSATLINLVGLVGLVAFAGGVPFHAREHLAAPQKANLRLNETHDLLDPVCAWVRAWLFAQNAAPAVHPLDPARIPAAKPRKAAYSPVEPWTGRCSHP